MAERLLARPLTTGGKKIVESTMPTICWRITKPNPKTAEELLAVGETKPDAKLDAPTLAAYTMVANELMNLDEALNK